MLYKFALCGEFPLISSHACQQLSSYPKRRATAALHQVLSMVATAKNPGPSVSVATEEE